MNQKFILRYYENSRNIVKGSAYAVCIKALFLSKNENQKAADSNDKKRVWNNIPAFCLKANSFEVIVHLRFNKPCLDHST